MTAAGGAPHPGSGHRIIAGKHGELVLPRALLDNLRAVHGDRLEPWLQALPGTIVDILSELDATIVPGTPDLSYHLVFFAERTNGDAITIKMTAPNEEQRPERAGVGVLSQAGIGPEVVWSDLRRGAFAMERVIPGTILPTHLPSLADDAGIVRTIGRVASRFPGEVSIDAVRDQLVPVHTYTRTLDIHDPRSCMWRDHRDQITWARTLRDALLANPDRTHGFVHGDLHHYNILQDADGQPVVIDPKGLIGPIGYDFGALTYNPVGVDTHDDLPALLRQRVAIWSDAVGLPWHEVRDWGYVGAIVSACWSAEAGAGGWQSALGIARTLRQLSLP